MKLFIKLAAVAVTASMFAACSGNKTSDQQQDPSAKATDSKTLVAYYSATGNTAKAAEEIAKATDGTLYEIEPVEAYTDADLDYENEQSRSTVEQKDPQARPEIKTGLDIAQYETVYVGFPVWWYDAPRLIYTFLDSYDFTGKKIVIFATAHSSNLDSSFEALQKAYPQYDLLKGGILNITSEKEFKAWIESLKPAATENK